MRHDRLECDFNPSLLWPSVRLTFEPLVVDHFEMDKFVLFGHSVGGGIAMTAAAFLPGECLAVVSESSQSFTEDKTVAGVREARTTFYKPEQIARLKKYHGDRTEWILNSWTETWLSTEFENWSLKDTLAKVECPILALHGDHDEYGTSAHPENICAWAGKKAKMYLMKNSGHIPHREKEPEVLDLVQKFLAEQFPEKPKFRK